MAEQRVDIQRLAEDFEEHRCTLGGRLPDPVTLTDRQLDELEQRARAATSGPWFRSRAWNGDGSDDAAHIAGCDPATILTLIAEVKRGRG